MHKLNCRADLTLPNSISDLSKNVLFKNNQQYWTAKLRVLEVKITKHLKNIDHISNHHIFSLPWCRLSYYHIVAYSLNFQMICQTSL